MGSSLPPTKETKAQICQGYDVVCISGCPAATCRLSPMESACQDLFLGIPHQGILQQRGIQFVLRTKRVVSSHVCVNFPPPCSTSPCLNLVPSVPHQPTYASCMVPYTCGGASIIPGKRRNGMPAAFSCTLCKENVINVFKVHSACGSRWHVLSGSNYCGQNMIH